MPRASRSKTGPNFLDYFRKFIRRRFLFFETIVALEVEFNSPTILFDNFNEGLLIDVYPPFVWLWCLVNVHVFEHSSYS